jgi:hypothetical protein
MLFPRVFCLALVLVVPVFAQTGDGLSTSLALVTTSETNPEPTNIATTTFVETVSDGDATSTTKSPNPTSTAPPPIGGGASCVQECLKKAAVGIGCKNRSVWRIEFESSFWTDS